ncbi:NADH-quinone oxidoreductase subunit NuoG [Pseudaeromonas sharmana]|uniref:NADH-quinone oxidoreductase n=1 Tax=Pseudaeromonas sharmana TaxID=328412 RepID=A0ABV8CQ42_9GAMM
MATIHIDGKEFEVDGADNLLQACLSLGLDVPYFCWHPALGSVGACRQCAVKQYQNADDKRGRLVMSCMTPASDGTFISIEDEEAKAFRKSVVEYLMTNHPHDCPVCEEGGACHLQDMTVMAGHNSRRYRFTKRTHKNQDLGPFISHEMNRCIACYRCVRFYKDYADGTDLGVYGAHDNVYFGRIADGALESEFSGNLVEVCPTGVFTDKTHSERFNRKWDMQFAPSICQQCSLGCNISPGERYGELRRIENRFNGAINHYFLCDRGRFGYGYVNRTDRPRQPELSESGARLPLTVDGALNRLADRLRSGKLVLGIGSPRASLESNFALRQLVGAENFFSGIGLREWAALHRMVQLQRSSGIPLATLREVEEHDAVIILGEDITQSAARLALSVRQAVKGKARELATALKVDLWQAAAVKTIGQNEHYPLIQTALAVNRLDDVTQQAFYGAYEDQARIGFALAHELDPDAPAVTDMSAAEQAVVTQMVSLLAHAKRPLVIAGTSAGSVALLDAAANLAKALQQRQQAVSLFLVAREVNSVGAALLGGAPLEQALAILEESEECSVIILENDLLLQADPVRVQRALQQAETVAVIDHQVTATTQLADIILPAATFAETDGTVVSAEARAQRFFQVFEPAFYDANSAVMGSWRWLGALEGVMQHRHLHWPHLDDIIMACATAIPDLAPIVEAAPNARFRIKGMKLARSPQRYSGRTAMLANHNVHEPRVAQDSDTAFAFSMEGYSGSQQPFQQVPFAWAPGWNSPSAWNKFQDEVGGHLRAGDPGLRLFEAQDGQALPYQQAIPERFVAHESTWQVVDRAQLFGSDELSMRAPLIAERAGELSAGISGADLSRLGLKEGDKFHFRWHDQQWSLPLRVMDGLAPGLLALPLGHPAVGWCLHHQTVHQEENA